jgi:hypothetical protein
MGLFLRRSNSATLRAELASVGKVVADAELQTLSRRVMVRVHPLRTAAVAPSDLLLNIPFDALRSIAVGFLV